jgi:hypothetical protein
VDEGATWSAVALAHNVGSRDEVDRIVELARANGATVTREASETFYGGYAGFGKPLAGPEDEDHAVRLIERRLLRVEGRRPPERGIEGFRALVVGNAQRDQSDALPAHHGSSSPSGLSSAA